MSIVTSSSSSRWSSLTLDFVETIGAFLAISDLVILLQTCDGWHREGSKIRTNRHRIEIYPHLLSNFLDWRHRCWINTLVVYNPDDDPTRLVTPAQLKMIQSNLLLSSLNCSIGVPSSMIDAASPPLGAFQECVTDAAVDSLFVFDRHLCRLTIPSFVILPEAASNEDPLPNFTERETNEDERHFEALRLVMEGACQCSSMEEIDICMERSTEEPIPIEVLRPILHVKRTLSRTVNCPVFNAS
jgi:hypothetical protein